MLLRVCACCLNTDIAHLAQLHDDIEESHFARIGCIEHFDIALQNFLIPLLLHVAQTDEELRFNLRKQCFLHFALEATQKEWAQEAMQARDDFPSLRRILQLEPGIEILRRTEQLRHQKVEQSPQLVQICKRRQRMSVSC